MINEYFFSLKESPLKKIQTAGSFAFRSSQFSEQSNQSKKQHVKKMMSPSFFNESSIKNINENESSQFVYFQNDSVLSGIDLGLTNNKKSLIKQKQVQTKKKKQIEFSRQIQFQDSLQKSNDIESSKIIDYGTGKSGLPLTLKKPKFAFKISQTAESSTILNDVQQSIANNSIEKQYQLQINNKTFQGQRNQNKKEYHQKQYKKIQQNQFNQYNFYVNQNSISSIKKPHKQPSLISKSISKSNSMSGSMNFKSVFRNKVEKASSLYKKEKSFKSNNSLLSYKSTNKQLLKNDDILQNSVKIADMKSLRELQNQLGKIKHQNKKIIQYMIEKDQKIQMLKKKKIQLSQEDPYAIIKENQLMKAFLSNKPKNKKSNKINIDKEDIVYGACLRSAKSMKELSLKKSSQISSLHDYDVKQHKFKVQPNPITKKDKKMILSNRGVLLSQKYLQVGFSLKESILTLYLTIKKQFSQLKVNLQQNSFILKDPIDRVLTDLPVEKQIKFKTEIKSTKCLNPQDQIFPICLKLSLLTQQKFEDQILKYDILLPITVYNLSKQIAYVSGQRSVQKSSSRITAKEIFRTQTFVSCRQMIRDPENYLMKVFPKGIFDKEDNIFYIGFLWKQKQHLIKIRLKERSFVIQGQGNPHHVTFQILRDIVSLLIEPKTQP